MKSKVYAVIDIGSNTTRLVLFKQEKTERLIEVENVKAVTRLRNYLNEENELTNDGINLLIDTLKSFREIINSYDVTNILCAATATIRQAENKEWIKDLIKQELGWDIRILSGNEEAYYGYLAVVNSTTITEGITVDLGGASTEVTYFKDRRLIDSHSFPFGALTLKHILTKHQSTAQLQTYIEKQIKTLSWFSEKDIPVIAIGGSARNLAQIDQNIKHYPIGGLHQYEMDCKDLKNLINYLTPLSFEQLKKLDGLSEDRADIIIPAAIAFYCICRQVNATSFILSRKGLREGIVSEHIYQKYENYLSPHVLEDSINELVMDYNVNKEQINQVLFLADKLIHELQRFKLITLTDEDIKFFKMAAHVFHLGQYIDSESSAQHTFYLLANRTIDGLMHKDRVKLAIIASFKNRHLFKQFFKPFCKWFEKQEKQKLFLLGALLKFTYTLDTTKRKAVQDIKLVLNDPYLEMIFICNKDILAEKNAAEKHKKHFAKAINQNVKLTFIAY